MTGTSGLKILLLAHDLSDAAIHRRAVMLREGGASVTVAGFRRTRQPIAGIAGCPAVNFGRTYNASFLQRIISVLSEAILLNRRRALFAGADIIIARNLEMLAIAVRGRSLCRPAPLIIYECLDIHRLLLRRDFIGSILRSLEGWLTRRASALFTSSPAFVSGYFNNLSKVRLPIRMIENKVIDTSGNTAPTLTARQAGPPWKIGWFGIIRCKKSLAILADLTRQSSGTIEVVIRGKPAPDQFENFEQIIDASPGMQFLGSYKSPDDLATMYQNVHFSWAIDMFEEGLNSSWLLPNRIYEGGAYACVPLALELVETGRFLKQLGVGVMLKEPLDKSLSAFFKELPPERYQTLEQAALAVPRSTWVYDRNDCKALVEYIYSLKGGAHD